MTAQDFLTQLLAHMGIDTATVEVSDQEDSLSISLHADEQESGLLIGRHAETLDALQHITRLLFQKDIEKPIILNINDFREQRESYLQDLSTRVAARVEETGRPQILRLNAHERRVVHMALSDHPSVTTQSEGEGPYRVLKVLPKSV